MKHSLSVIIPLLNEEENVEPVTKELARTLEDASISYEIICVSNGSTDQTEEIIQQVSCVNPHIKGIYLKEKGYGRAIIAGFEAATMDLFTFVGGDGQVDPRDIVKAYEVMERTDADIVKPRRTHRSDGWHRAILSLGHTLLLKIMFGLPGWDIDGPPKIIKREFVKKLSLSSEYYFLDPEIMIKTKHAGGSMVEVNVGWRLRERCTPHVAQALIRVSWQIFKEMVRWRLHYRTLVTEKVPVLKK